MSICINVSGSGKWNFCNWLSTISPESLDVAAIQAVLNTWKKVPETRRRPHILSWNAVGLGSSTGSCVLIPGALDRWSCAPKPRGLQRDVQGMRTSHASVLPRFEFTSLTEIFLSLFHLNPSLLDLSALFLASDFLEFNLIQSEWEFVNKSTFATVHYMQNSSFFVQLLKRDK